MQQKQLGNAIKRINKDLDEIRKNPIQGLSIAMTDENDPFTLYCNIKILDGIYTDVILHLIMKIPNDYPVTAPSMWICTGQPFSHSFHHHVFDNYPEGSSICIDLLNNGWFHDSGNKKCGWTPAYTLSSILVQLQVFFADPDFGSHVPEKQKIDQMKEKLKQYKHEIKLTDGSIKVHTVQDPYPPFNEEQDMQMIQENQSEQDISKFQAIQKLSCFTTKLNPLEDEGTIIGYPMDVQIDKFNRLRITPSLEFLSYEGYCRVNNPNVEYSNKIQYKSAKIQNKTSMGDFFNNWMPIYFSEKNYIENKQLYLQCLDVYKFQGINGPNTQQKQIIKTFSNIMNQMIVQLQKGEKYATSVAAIDVYTQILRLFLRFIEEFPIIQTIIDNRVTECQQSFKMRHKDQLGDIGEFMILLGLSSQGMDNKQVQINLIQEYIARQIYWIIDKRGGKGNQRSFDITSHKLDEMYNDAIISNQLLIFNIAASRQFLNDKKNFIQTIDSNFGAWPADQTESFLKVVKDLGKSIQSYRSLFDFVGLNDFIKNNNDSNDMIDSSIYLSLKQGYSNKNFIYPKKQNFLEADFQDLEKKIQNYISGLKNK